MTDPIGSVFRTVATLPMGRNSLKLAVVPKTEKPAESGDSLNMSKFSDGLSETRAALLRAADITGGLVLDSAISLGFVASGYQVFKNVYMLGTTGKLGAAGALAFSAFAWVCSTKIGDAISVRERQWVVNHHTMPGLSDILAGK